MWVESERNWLEGSPRPACPRLAGQRPAVVVRLIGKLEEIGMLDVKLIGKLDVIGMLEVKLIGRLDVMGRLHG